MRVISPPPTPRTQPAKVEERSDPLGGYRIVGAEPREITGESNGFYLETPDGIHLRGEELTRDGQSLLAAGDSRGKVVQVLGKPVGYNLDASIWGYWTRNLANPKMGILLRFDSKSRIRQIELHTDWSRLAVELAQIQN